MTFQDGNSSPHLVHQQLAQGLRALQHVSRVPQRLGFEHVKRVDLNRRGHSCGHHMETEPIAHGLPLSVFLLITEMTSYVQNYKGNNEPWGVVELFHWKFWTFGGVLFAINKSTDNCKRRAIFSRQNTRKHGQYCSHWISDYGISASAVLGAGKTRTHCGGNVADVIMFTKCLFVLPRAQHLCPTQMLCPGHMKCLWKSSETFLVSGRRATMLLRFATDGQHRMTHCCRHNVSSFCRGLIDNGWEPIRIEEKSPFL